jgi:hypothetical protein
MTAKCKLATVLIPLAFLGCRGAAPTSVANDVKGTAAASSSGTQAQHITDPTLNNMNAFTVTIPSKWHFQGVLFQGGKCGTVPYAVFRATSPDGLTSVERLPVLGWMWGSGPMYGYTPKTDCLPLTGPMSAQDFLKYLAATMKLQYVKDEPVASEEIALAQKALRDAEATYAPQYAAMHTAPPKTTRELAWAEVRSQNGSFVLKGRLKVMVECIETHFAGLKSVLRGMADQPPSTISKCSAGVTYLSAPESEYAGLIQKWNTPGMGGHAEDAWQQAWIRRNTEQSQQFMDEMRRNTQAQMQAQQQQFNHDQAVRQQIHEEFMATMQRGTDMSMARAQASMNARSTATSDWVDYALDRRTVMDPNTGQVSKVPSAYSYTWVDSTGKVSYQTNDPNANPNGVLKGDWTKQAIVHGDGSQ